MMKESASNKTEFINTISGGIAPNVTPSERIDHHQGTCTRSCRTTTSNDDRNNDTQLLAIAIVELDIDDNDDEDENDENDEHNDIESETKEHNEIRTDNRPGEDSNDKSSNGSECHVTRHEPTIINSSKHQDRYKVRIYKSDLLLNVVEQETATGSRTQSNRVKQEQSDTNNSSIVLTTNALRTILENDLFHRKQQWITVPTLQQQQNGDDEIFPNYYYGHYYYHRINHKKYRCNYTIYHPEFKTYVPLNVIIRHGNNDTEVLDIIKMFGRRLRIRIEFKKSITTTTTTTTKQSHYPKYKSICGRYFGNDLVVASSTNNTTTNNIGNNELQLYNNGTGEIYRLYFNEQSNQHNSTTGYTIWDGSLLMTRYLEYVVNYNTTTTTTTTNDNNTNNNDDNDTVIEQTNNINSTDEKPKHLNYTIIPIPNVTTVPSFSNLFVLHHNVTKMSFIIELGAGCGVSGIAAATLGCPNVILTDLPDVIPLLQSNIHTNIPSPKRISNEQVSTQQRQQQPIEIGLQESLPHQVSPIGVVPCVCDWTKPLATELLTLLSKGCQNPTTTAAAINCDDDDTKSHNVLILVSDCIWMEELVEPLLVTIQTIITYIQSTVLENRYYTESIVTVLIVYQRRGKGTDEAFWSLLQHYLTSNENCCTNVLNDLETIGIHDTSDKFYITSSTFTKTSNPQ